MDPCIGIEICILIRIEIRNIIVVDNIVNAARCVNKQAAITAHLCRRRAIYL